MPVNFKSTARTTFETTIQNEKNTDFSFMKYSQFTRNEKKIKLKKS